jgi:hypothetical protein
LISAIFIDQEVLKKSNQTGRIIHKDAKNDATLHAYDIQLFRMAGLTKLFVYGQFLYAFDTGCLVRK